MDCSFVKTTSGTAEPGCNPSAPLPADLRRVAVFMTDNHLGDFVLAMPTLFELGRYFQNGMDLIVAAQHAPLAALLDIPARIIPYEHQTHTKKSPRQLMHFVGMYLRLATARYQAAIFCKGRITESSFALATHAPVRVALANMPRRFAYNRLIDNSNAVHESEKIGRILECIGRSIAPCLPQITPPTETQTLLDDRLLQLNKAPEAPLIVLHPFAGKETRCWPRERFIALADELITRHNATVALIGAPHERAALDEMAAALCRPDQSFVQAGSLLELLSLFRRADLLFSNESGPTHLASLTDIPIVTLFGPTIEAQWRPLRQKKLTILRGLERCRPCRHAACPLDWACIRNITVEQALGAVETFLLRQTNSPL